MAKKFESEKMKCKCGKTAIYSIRILGLKKGEDPCYSKWLELCEKCYQKTIKNLEGKNVN